MAKHRTARIRDGVARHILFGFLALAALFGGVGAWAASFSISGAVIAPGAVAIDGNSKRVQHPEGGVVAAIRVRDGDVVAAGELLLRLDDTVIRANLQIVEHQLVTHEARRARLAAERLEAKAIASASALAGREGEPVVAAALSGEQRLFEARGKARAGQLDRLKERLAQLTDERSGLAAQLAAKDGELALIAPELVKLEDMLGKGLVTAPRVLTLRREKTRIEGEHGKLTADLARSRSQTGEIEVQILQVGRDTQAEIEKELRETEDAIAELTERKVAAEDRLRRLDIRAPREGIVTASTVHTVGGVAGAGETLMFIVPREDALAIEARIAPSDVDQVFAGQSAVISMTGLSQRTTPELNGSVERIAADLTQDEKTGAAYYVMRVNLPPHEIARLGEVKLTPGMPAEVFAQTAKRSALSYFLKPLSDHLARAMREG